MQVFNPVGYLVTQAWSAAMKELYIQSIQGIFFFITTKNKSIKTQHDPDVKTCKVQHAQINMFKQFQRLKAQVLKSELHWHIPEAQNSTSLGQREKSNHWSSKIKNFKKVTLSLSCSLSELLLRTDQNVWTLAHSWPFKLYPQILNTRPIWVAVICWFQGTLW